MTNKHEDDSDALMQFLYRSPIGLLQTTLDGTIEMINPMSASLLMPLSRNGDLDNLFEALEEVAPQLRELVAGYEPSNGAVCDSLRFGIPAGGASAAATQTLSISLLKLDEVRLMAMVSDVTLEVQREKSELARQLDDALRTDTLTQLPNRIALQGLIQRAIERARIEPSYEYAVLFMNGDRFKQINDSLGLVAGDQVLCLVADRLRTTLRLRNYGDQTLGHASMAGRLGSDEFVVLLDNLRSAGEVRSVALRLLDVLSQPYSVLGQQLHFTTSIGVLLRAHATGDADAVLQDSSIAMVEAKRAGGARCVVFDPSMHERAARRMDVQTDLRRALLNNELFVVYQPVVALQISDSADCPASHAAGVEALVRWRHPTRGVVPPVEFIGIAEECGLIGAIGEFVLSTACHQFTEWQRELGRLAPRLLGVNLSRGQLGDSRFAEFVERTLRSSGMQPADLQLEVTESMAAQDESVQARLRELNALGLSLALDDFGTGYSSLASLHQLPVGTVKIDRSFVSEVVSSPHHRVLIEATVRVARSLGMGTVAEGIETQAQADLVRELGCEKGQGYLFSRPLSAPDLVHWLKSNDVPSADGIRELADENALRIA